MGNIHYILFSKGSKLPNDCYPMFVSKQNTKIKAHMCKEDKGKQQLLMQNTSISSCYFYL